MPFTFAGHWLDSLTNHVGVPLPSTPAAVFLRGTTTLATLYTSRLKATTAANPTTTDVRGNLSIYADPGEYDILCNGVTLPVNVPIDTVEAAQDQDLANYVPLTQRGAALGVATLNAAGQVVQGSATSVVIPTPLTIPGLQGWYCASYESGLGDTDPVSTFHDLSGKGRHLVQAGAARPTYKASGIGAKPSILFSGTQRLVAATAADWKFLHDGTGMTILAVAQTTGAAPNADMTMLDTGGLSSTLTGFAFYLTDAGAPVARATLYIQRGVANESTYFGPTVDNSAATATPHIWSSRFLYQANGADAELSIDGTVVTLGEAGFAPSTAAPSGALTLGSSHTATAGWVGQISELIMYNRRLTDAELATVLAYLS